MITVKIWNGYTDGHESTSVVEIPVAPTDLSEEAIDTWFEDNVFDHTGDGHYTDVYDETEGRVRLGSAYIATVIAAPDCLGLEGSKYEWLD